MSSIPSGRQWNDNLLKFPTQTLRSFYQASERHFANNLQVKVKAKKNIINLKDLHFRKFKAPCTIFRLATETALETIKYLIFSISKQRVVFR